MIFLNLARTDDMSSVIMKVGILLFLFLLLPAVSVYATL